LWKSNLALEDRKNKRPFRAAPRSRVPQRATPATTSCAPLCTRPRARGEDVLHALAVSGCLLPLPSPASWTVGLSYGLLLEHGIASAQCPWQAWHARLPWEVFLRLSSAP
jgi:hypothetical protein